MDYGYLIQLILEALITVLLPFVLRRLFSWVDARIDEVKSSKNAKDLELVTGLVHQFVLAAEQLGLSGELAKLGLEKKRYVIEMVEAELDRRGITIDLDTLDAMIEAQVMASFNQFKEKQEGEPLVAAAVA